jgi:hypothetical protein
MGWIINNFPIIYLGALVFFIFFHCHRKISRIDGNIDSGWILSLTREN